MTRLEYVQKKIHSVESLKMLIQTWRLKGEKIAFTNGCFDILHQGHVTYLAQSAGYANRLIVGLNTDASVKRQGKGDNRPVNAEDSRLLVLASLGFVDAVVLFDSDTPFDLIKELQPDVLLKGADYNPEQTDSSQKDYIVGSDIVRENGGEVIAVPLVEGFSTTSIIKKMQE